MRALFKFINFACLHFPMAAPESENQPTNKQKTERFWKAESHPGKLVSSHAFFDISKQFSANVL